jgi:hypothetical protein
VVAQTVQSNEATEALECTKLASSGADPRTLIDFTRNKLPIKQYYDQHPELLKKINEIEGEDGSSLIYELKKGAIAFGYPISKASISTNIMGINQNIEISTDNIELLKKSIEARLNLNFLLTDGYYSITDQKTGIEYALYQSQESNSIIHFSCGPNSEFISVARQAIENEQLEQERISKEKEVKEKAERADKEAKEKAAKVENDFKTLIGYEGDIKVYHEQIPFALIALGSVLLVAGGLFFYKKTLQKNGDSLKKRLLNPAILIGTSLLCIALGGIQYTRAIYIPSLSIMEKSWTEFYNKGIFDQRYKSDIERIGYILGQVGSKYFKDNSPVAIIDPIREAEFQYMVTPAKYNVKEKLISKKYQYFDGGCYAGLRRSVFASEKNGDESKLKLIMATDDISIWFKDVNDLYVKIEKKLANKSQEEVAIFLKNGGLSDVEADFYSHAQLGLHLDRNDAMSYVIKDCQAIGFPKIYLIQF